MDFAEVPRKEGYQHTLLLVGTCSGWPEAFPCRTNTAKEVVKLLFNHTVLRFGIPWGMPSHRGVRFVTTVVKEVSQILGITLISRP